MPQEYTERGPSEMPRYFRLHADEFMSLTKGLPRAQAAKLLYAMTAYFFLGTEPEDGDLPRAARQQFDMQRKRLENYRAKALAGRKSSQKTDEKSTENRESLCTKFTQEVAEVFDIPFTPLPAETSSAPSRVPSRVSPRVPSNNNKQETINISNSISLVTKGRPHRAAAGAAQGRPAPALPSRAEFDRICRKLEDEGLDAITDAEREAYHAGYAAYRCE